MNQMEVDYLLSDKLHPFKTAVSLRCRDYNNQYQSAAHSIIGKDKNPVHIKQVHGSTICSVEEKCEEGDGLYTSDVSHAPFIVTADCFSIFFHTDNESVFGVVHAGWRSIAGGILSSLKNIMRRRTFILIGHGICRKHFLVDSDVERVFRNKFGGEHIHKKENKFQIDLRNIIEQQLKDYAEIKHLKMCSICSNEILYSHRREGTNNRNISIIWRPG